MPCCCNKPPRVRLTRQVLFSALPVWNDNHRCPQGAQRLVQWRFYKNQSPVWTTPAAPPTAPLEIGIGSTGLRLNATPAQISAYLQAQGIALSGTDSLCVDVWVQNCQGETARSNRLCFEAEVPTVDCDCAFVTAFDEGQSGATALAPAGYTPQGGELVFQGGLMNPEGNDFTLLPLTPQDALAWVTLNADCPASLQMAEVTGAVGTVNIPPAFATVPAQQYLLFRNGAAQRTFSVSGGQITPAAAPSASSDRWHFVRLTGGDCTLGRSTIQASGSGAAFTLPAGFSEANQNKWLLFVNELLQYPGRDYTVSGAAITLATAAAEDQIWIVFIH